MFPTIPNRLPQLLVVIGLALFIYSFISSETIIDKFNELKYNHDLIKSDTATDLLLKENDNLKFKLQNTHLEILYRIDSALLAKKGDTSSLEYLKKSEVLAENRNTQETRFFDSFIQKNNDKLAVLNKSVAEHNKVLNEYESKHNIYFVLEILGFILFVIGILLWVSNERFEKELLLRNNFDKPLTYQNCQSCSRIFNSLVKKGTESNGEINYSFCEKCYSKGKFKEPKLTKYDVIERIWRARKKQPHSKWKIIRRFDDYLYYSLVGSKIRNAERWNKNRYITVSDEIFNRVIITTLITVIACLIILIIINFI